MRLAQALDEASPGFLMNWPQKSPILWEFGGWGDTMRDADQGGGAATHRADAS